MVARCPECNRARRTYGSRINQMPTKKCQCGARKWERLDFFQYSDQEPIYKSPTGQVYSVFFPAIDPFDGHAYELERRTREITVTDWIIKKQAK